MSVNARAEGPQIATGVLRAGLTLSCAVVGAGGLLRILRANSGAAAFAGSVTATRNFGPFDFDALVRADAFAGGALVLTSGVGGVDDLYQDPSTGALVGAGGSTVLNLENVGTDQAPVYELRGSVLPRSGTLAQLTSLTSGGGELCYATDVDAIVQLRGTTPNGTAAVYSPLGAGVWDADSYKLQNPADSTYITLGGRDDPLGADGGVVYIKGGGSGDAAGGAVYINGGDALNDDVDGGSVFLMSGDSGMGGTCGDVVLSGAWNPGTAGGGNIFLTAGAAGYVGINPAGSNQPVVRVTAAGALGFFNSAGTTKPTVSGSRGGNAALASLLTALAGMGLITNSSSA